MTSGELVQILEGHGFTHVPERSTSQEVVILCPNCADVSGNRGVNIKTLATNCWRCGQGGGLKSWAKKLGLAIDLGDTAPQGVSIDELGTLLEKLDQQHEVVTPSGYIPEVKLPEGFTLVADAPDSAYARLILKMARRKRLDWDALVAARVGFTRTAWRWEPFAIFPVFEWGRPVYYQGRTYVDRPGESTKQFPTRQECPLSSRYWIYGLDELVARGGKIILVEAIMNVLSLRREIQRRGLTDITPVAVFKHKLSQRQFDKLVQAALRAAQGGHPVVEWVFMYDGRTRTEVEQGRPGDALAAARRDAQLIYGTVPVSVVELPDKTDPNDDAALALDYFAARSPFTFAPL